MKGFFDLKLEIGKSQERQDNSKIRYQRMLYEKISAN